MLSLSSKLAVLAFLALTVQIQPSVEEKERNPQKQTRKRSLPFPFEFPLYQPEFPLPVALHAIEHFQRHLPETWLQPHPFFDSYPIEYELPAPPSLPPLIRFMSRPIPHSTPVTMEDSLDFPQPWPQPRSQGQAVQLGSGSLGVVSLGNGQFALGSGSLGYTAVPQQNASAQQERQLLQVGQVSRRLPRQRELFLPDPGFLSQVLLIRRRDS